VFDPLALTLLLAATKTLEWERGINILQPVARKPNEDDPEEKEFFDRARDTARAIDTGTYQAPEEPNPYQGVQPDAEHWYDHVDEAEPIKKNSVLAGLDSMWSRAKKLVVKDSEAEHAPLSAAEEQESRDKLAERAWKEENPDGVLKVERQKLRNGKIDKLPWQDPEFQARVLQDTKLEADNVPQTYQGEVKGFGTAFPNNPVKGDMFLRVDHLPSILYKFNGATWIEVDKALSDQHAWDDAYIDHLIEKISSGEYDPDLLTDAERDRIEERLKLQP
jgi:hypothetical protein